MRTAPFVVAAALAAGAVGLAPTAGAAPARAVAAARADWKTGATVDAADRGRYLKAARNQLPTKYAHERADLAAIIALPLTDTTAAQRTTVARATRELNGFFLTGGLYGFQVENPRALAKGDWVKANTVDAADMNSWLGSAVDELDAYGTRYAAQVADLTSLQAIPLTDTTAAQRATAAKDRKALNAFFGTQQ